MLRNMVKDRRGGIEGLPLQLMIVIMVATMGCAVIVGWMGDLDSPHYIKTLGIEENVVVIDGNEIGDITVCVLDEKNEPLQGVSVMITNKQVSPPEGKDFVTTDKEGKAVLEGWTLSGYPKGSIKLVVTGYLSGYTECTEYVEGLIR